MDAIDIIAFVFLLIRFVVLIPTMLFGLYLFHKFKNEQFICHRNPFLIYIITILTILTLSIERTFLTSAFVWNIIDVHKWIVYLVLSIFWWALFALFTVKVYDLYYQQQYNISIADQIWKREINPQTVDWYIKNKHKWGSTTWVTKICLIPYIISCVVETMFPQIFGEGLALDFCHSAIVSFPVCVSLVVVYKARKLVDIWKIRDETLYQGLSMLFITVVYTITFCVGYIPSLQQKYGQNFARFKWILISFFSDIITILFAILPTFYPIYLIKKSSNQSLMKQYQFRSDISISICSMNLIMSKYYSFQLFMQHLVSEFTAENALFLVELVQIKYEHQKRNNFRVSIPKPKNIEETFLIDFNMNPFDGEPYKSDEDRYFTYLFHEVGSIRCKVSIPIEVAKSSIVTKNENDLVQQMSCLYMKYVAVDRLNISYKIHQKLDAIFMSQRELNDEEVFNAMDECAADILMLLQTSFGRFITKDSFAPILQEIKNEMGDINDKIRSDVKMKELFNSKSVPIVTTRQLIHYYN